MAAGYILIALAVVFCLAAIRNLAAGRGFSHPQTRTWLLVAVIFTLVSAWVLLH